MKTIFNFFYYKLCVKKLNLLYLELKKEEIYRSMQGLNLLMFDVSKGFVFNRMIELLMSVITNERERVEKLDLICFHHDVANHLPLHYVTVNFYDESDVLLIPFTPISEVELKTTQNLLSNWKNRDSYNIGISDVFDENADLMRVEKNE